MSLVFYDTETTGTNTFFDQILQFAAIKTDEELNEIDRFTVRCRLLPHVVPSPGAVSVTGVTVSELVDTSLPSHYEMVRGIRTKLLSWCPALFMGWNSIVFDEDLMRQALYKTLHNPYLTNRVGNSRSDAMRVVQACSLFAPEALTFPTNEEGQKVFKLERIAPANGFVHGHAHDAMGDVKAMIFLCRLIVEKAPDVWSSFMRFSKKAAVVDYITNERMFCLTDFFYGKPYSWIVTAIGQNKDNSAEWYVYNLGVDPESLRSLSKAQLEGRLEELPKPVRKLKSNATPMLFPAEDAPEICKDREIGLEELGRRAALLQENTALRERLVSSFESQRTEYTPSPHIENQIYDSFFERSDERLMDAFHDAAWPMRLAIVEKFQDQRLRAIGRQLIHLERPDLLDEALCRKYNLAVAKRVLGQGEDMPWLTIPQALEQLEGMLENVSGVELDLLRTHKEYLHKRHKQALAHVKALPAVI